MFPFITKLKSDLITQYRGLDKTILYGAFILMVCGFFLTLAASPGVAERTHLPNLYHFVIRQAIWVLPSLGVMLGVDDAGEAYSAIVGCDFNRGHFVHDLYFIVCGPDQGGGPLDEYRPRGGAALRIC